MYSVKHFDKDIGKWVHVYMTEDASKAQSWKRDIIRQDPFAMVKVVRPTPDTVAAFLGVGNKVY